MKPAPSAGLCVLQHEQVQRLLALGAVAPGL